SAARSVGSEARSAVSSPWGTPQSLQYEELLEVYQADLLKELVEGEEIKESDITELRRTADLSLRATKETARAIGRSMAALVATERHLWLTLSDMKKKDTVFLLDAPLAPSGLFSNAVNSVVDRYQEARGCSANPASASERDGLQQAFASVSARKRSGAGELATPKGFSGVASSGVSCRETISGHHSSGSNNTRGQSRETGFLSRSFGSVETTVYCRAGLPHSVRRTSAAVQRGLSHSGGPEQGLVIEQEVATLLRKETIEVVPPHDRESGFYSQYFIVPKKDGGLRPILDLHLLNRSVMRLKFKMLTISQVVRSSPRTTLSRNVWMLKTKRQEKRAFSISEDHLSRRGVGFEHDPGTSVSCMGRVYPHYSCESEGRPVTHCQAVPATAGSHGSCVQHDTFWPAVHETPTVLAQDQGVLPEGKRASHDQGHVAMPTCLGHVEETLVLGSGPSAGSSLSSRNTSDGCVSHRLGSGHGRPPCPQSVERSPSHLAHKLPGDAGRVPCAEALSPRPERPPCVGPHRQHSGGLLHQPPGRSAFAPLVQAGAPDPCVVPGQTPLAESSACPGVSQFGSRRPVEAGAEARGMDASPRGGEADLEIVWPGSGGPLRDSGECAMSPLVLSESSSSPGAGCHGTDVAEASSVRFSPDRSREF
ncbi:hypothetical protein M9458_056832, partial [Cirrhinus mrigala]